MAIPDDKWQCEGCKSLYAIDEEDEEGEENQDYEVQFYCNECDVDEETPYCGTCVLYFEGTEMTYCSDCLNEALKESNLKGHVVEKIVEKVVEKPVYIKENGSSTPIGYSSETMEEFEKRIMG